MSNEREPSRDWRTVALVALGVLVLAMAGVIIGFIAAGGLNDDPSAASDVTTTLPTGTTLVPGTTFPPPDSTITVPDITSTTSQSPPSAGTVPPDTSVPGQITFTASADTFTSAEEPNTPFGDSPELVVENDPPDISLSLLRFELSGIPDDVEIESATLRLYLLSGSGDPVSLYTVSGEWSEEETTAGTAPLIGDRVAANLPVPVESGFIEVDIASAVSGNDTVDLYLASLSEDSSDFSSREGAFPPTLTVIWGG